MSGIREQVKNMSINEIKDLEVGCDMGCTRNVPISCEVIIWEEYNLVEFECPICGRSQWVNIK